jgi:hypothetical protein
MPIYPEITHSESRRALKYIVHHRDLEQGPAQLALKLR